MKIIIIGTAYPFRGGLAAFNERLASQFQNEGHEVVMYTFTLQYPKVLFPGKTQFTSDPAPRGLTIRRCINSCNPFNWLKVGRELRRQQPDMVVFAYWMSFMAPCFGTIARQVRLGKKTRCIALVHNMIPHEPNVLDKLFPGYFVKAMDGFTALSQSVVKDIEKFDHKGKPKSWAPHPIYDHYGALVDKAEARRQLGLDADGKYVLFFGFIRDYKGLDLLINAFGDPRLQDCGARLIVAGEFYGDPAPYLKRIHSLDISDIVVLHNDYIPDSKVNLYFRACDIVAQPYKSATQSGVTQVAFHFEKPMLVTRVGGLPEIVPDGKIGYVVDVDAQSIADALLKFYKENREEEFSAAVREEKQKYSWDRMTAAIVKAFTECLDNKDNK
ncbi:MAG: glycosyltransferase [Bacteroidales bacterium]|nr:glycosyltransferase [Bacteroidales bacterium]